MQTINILHSDEKKKRRFPAFIYVPLRISLSISLLIILLSIIFYPQLQPEIPLFYSLPRSSQQLAHKLWIFFFPLLSIFITVSHFFMISVNSQIKNRLKKLFSWTTVILQILLFLIFIRIIYIIH